MCVCLARDPNEKTEAEAEQAKSEANVQSFRSDRRLVRLVRCRVSRLVIGVTSLPLTHVVSCQLR